MSKKQTYLYILAAGIILILAGFFMHISLITSAYHTIGKMVANPLVFGRCRRPGCQDLAVVEERDFRHRKNNIQLPFHKG